MARRGPCRSNPSMPQSGRCWHASPALGSCSDTWCSPQRKPDPAHTRCLTLAEGFGRPWFSSRRSCTPTSARPWHESGMTLGQIAIPAHMASAHTGRQLCRSAQRRPRPRPRQRSRAARRCQRGRAQHRSPAGAKAIFGPRCSLWDPAALYGPLLLFMGPCCSLWAPAAAPAVPCAIPLVLYRVRLVSQWLYPCNVS